MASYKERKVPGCQWHGCHPVRRIDSDEIVEYYVDGDELKVVDIPPGYTHSIENLGDRDMVTIMWANEPFNANNPDTYYLEV